MVQLIEVPVINYTDETLDVPPFPGAEYELFLYNALPIDTESNLPVFRTLSELTMYQYRRESGYKRSELSIFLEDLRKTTRYFDKIMWALEGIDVDDKTKVFDAINRFKKWSEKNPMFENILVNENWIKSELERFYPDSPSFFGDQ